MRHTLAALLLITASLVQAQSGDDARQARARLEQLERDIAAITREQRQRESERSALEKTLQVAETALGQLHRQLRESGQAIAQNRSKIDAARKEQAVLRKAAKQQLDAVATELRAAWKGGDKDQLRLLLNDSDPQRLARMLAYYRYILDARSDTIERYQATLAELASVDKQLSRRETQLEEQRATLANRERDLDARQAERRTALGELEAALANDALTLAARQRDRGELEQTLQKIEEALAQLVPEEDVQAFADARGRMPWPVEGQLTERFGRPRNQGKMRWQGVRLKAGAGTPVTAIHHGRVVYADWLRGSGLLLVIDHGQGYMSLYAHNESLLHEVGDWVSTGATVATVGDSGGQSEAGLYFEIRKDGKPTDPQRWCRT